MYDVSKNFRVMPVKGLKVSKAKANAKAKPKKVYVPSSSSSSSDDEEGERRMKEEGNIKTRTPFYPWFHDHVQRSAKSSFTPLYYTLGLMEEMSKELEARRNMKGWPPKNMEEMVEKTGDICWYIYGLCGSLEGVTPETVEDDGFELFDDDQLSVLGPLCGTIKKWSRGDQDWAALRPRVQANVSRALRHLADKSFVPLDTAMRANIAKMRSSGN